MTVPRQHLGKKASVIIAIILALIFTTACDPNTGPPANIDKSAVATASQVADIALCATKFAAPFLGGNADALARITELAKRFGDSKDMMEAAGTDNPSRRLGTDAVPHAGAGGSRPHRW